MISERIRNNILCGGSVSIYDAQELMNFFTSHGHSFTFIDADRNVTGMYFYYRDNWYCVYFDLDDNAKIENNIVKLKGFYLLSDGLYHEFFKFVHLDTENEKEFETGNAYTPEEMKDHLQVQYH